MRKTMYVTRYTDPEAVGYLVAEHVRCGRPGCRCQQGAKHGPYWYLRFRRLESGVWRQRKQYVPANQVSTVRRRLARAKARDRAAMGILAASRRLRGAVRKRMEGQMSDTELMEMCHGIAGAGQGN